MSIGEMFTAALVACWVSGHCSAREIHRPHESMDPRAPAPQIGGEAGTVLAEDVAALRRDGSLTDPVTHNESRSYQGRDVQLAIDDTPAATPFGAVLPDFLGNNVSPYAASGGAGLTSDGPAAGSTLGVLLTSLHSDDVSSRHDDPAEGPMDSSFRDHDELCRRPTGWKRFVCDSRALGRHLLLKEPGDRWRALGVLGATGFLYGEREKIRHFVLAHRTPSRTRVYDRARILGKGIATPLIASALYFGGKLSSSSYHVESAQILLESSLHAGLLAVAGQIVIASERPEDGDEVAFFRLSGHGASGDVAITASVVAPLDRRYMRFAPGDGFGRKVLKTVGRAGLYAALALTAAQRMDADKHWAPDVLLGAAAGLTAGYSICSAHESSPRSMIRSKKAQIVPVPGGLAVAWSF